MDILKIFKDCEEDYYINPNGDVASTIGEAKIPFDEWIAAALAHDSWDAEDQAEYMQKWYECQCEGCLEVGVYGVCDDIDAWMAEYNDEKEYAMGLEVGDQVTFVKGKCEYSYTKIGLGIGIFLGIMYYVSKRK